MSEIIASQPDRGVDLLLTNQIQLLPADQYYGFSFEEMQIKWIEKYSKWFREIITEHPELVVQFQQDQTNALEQLKNLLYQEQVA